MFVVKLFHTEYGNTYSYRYGRIYSTQEQAEKLAQRKGDAMVCNWDRPVSIFRGGVLQADNCVGLRQASGGGLA